MASFSINRIKLQSDSSRSYKFEESGFNLRDWFDGVEANEDIKCVILASYNISLSSLQNDFPSLFKLDVNKINMGKAKPTLVLHGSKGDFSLRDESRREDSDDSHFTVKVSVRHVETDERYEFDYKLPSTVHIEEVLPQFPRIEGECESQEEEKSEDGRQRKEETQSQFQSDSQIHDSQYSIYGEDNNEFYSTLKGGSATGGVHHPKFMLIFTDKGCHMLVSTHNFCNAVAVDGSWTYFFPLANRHRKWDVKDIGGDFGEILADMLWNQEQQLKSLPKDSDREWLGPSTFLEKYLNLKLEDLPLAYAFETANVDLVSVVPCRRKFLRSFDLKEGEEVEALRIPTVVPDGACVTCRLHELYQSNSGPFDVTYGAERCLELLERHKHKIRQLGSSDRVIWQPTSIGKGMQIQALNYYMDCFMPDDMDTWSKIEDKKQKLSRLSLIWPEETLSGTSGLCFFTPEILMNMDEEVLEQMVTYVPWTNFAADSKEVLDHSIHIKSIARLLSDTEEGTDETIASQSLPPFTCACKCRKLAWFLLTSACMSEGAQGVIVEPGLCPGEEGMCRRKHGTYMEYRNFELGVLFHSTESCTLVQSNQSQSTECPVPHPEKSQLHLPIPYDIFGGESYLQVDETENMKLVHCPCFHQWSGIDKVRSRYNFDFSKRGSNEISIVTSGGLAVYEGDYEALLPAKRRKLAYQEQEEDEEKDQERMIYIPSTEVDSDLDN
jgi:hypothetical protein